MATSMTKRFGSEEKNQQVVGRNGQRKCAPCQKKRKDVVAVKYCYDCKQYQCEDCSQCHVLFDAMAGHKLEHVRNIKPGTSHADLKGRDMCSPHNKQLEYICKEHDELCCAKCAIVLHRGCQVDEIMTEASRSKIPIADVTKKLEAAETNANDLLKNLKSQAIDDKLVKQYQQMIKTIDETKQKIVPRFDGIKADVTSKYKEAEKANSQQIKTNIIESEAVLDEIQTSTKLLTDVGQHGLDHQKYIAAKLMKQRAVSCKSVIGQIQAKSYKLELSFQFYREVKDVLNEDLALANYHINTIPLYPDIPVIEMAVDLKLAASVEVKQGKGDQDLPFYSGLAFLRDGRLVVIDNTNNRVHIMDDRLEKLGTCMLDYTPRGVAVMSDIDVAVICFGFLLFLRINKSNRIGIIRTIKTHPTSSYFCISVIDDELFLVGAFRDDEQFISMITTAGKELVFNDLPERIYGVDSSFCTYMRKRNRIVHTDRLADTVTMYNVDAEWALKKQVVVNDCLIKVPRGVCCMPDDSLFVCSAGTHSLVHISPDGSVISSYELEMKHPFIVSTDGRKVAVCNTAKDNYKLQLYNVTKVH